MSIEMLAKVESDFYVIWFCEVKSQKCKLNFTLSYLFVIKNLLSQDKSLRFIRISVQGKHNILNRRCLKHFSKHISFWWTAFKRPLFGRIIRVIGHLYLPSITYAYPVSATGQMDSFFGSRMGRTTWVNDPRWLEW